MNYNANAMPRQGLGRKMKRVSDVNAMGPSAPQNAPPFNPYPGQPPQDQFASSTPMYSQPGFRDYPQYPNNQAPFMEPSPMQNSSFGPSQPSQLGSGGQFSAFSQPIVQNMAFEYGQQLANQGRNIVKQEIEKYVPVTRLKYYFAVDTRYVLSKLRLVFFPFTHDDWSIKYQQDNPVQPRFEINAPDLYIPFMAYVTYVLMAGLMLGVQKKFTPEQIGITASSALAYCVVELAIYMGTLYITNTRTTLRWLDMLAFSGYKYAGIIVSVVISLIAGKMGYYIALAYCSLALAFFLVRSLKTQVLTGTDVQPVQQMQYQQYGGMPPQGMSGTKRRMYFLLFVALLQPLLSWWLSFHLVV